MKIIALDYVMVKHGIGNMNTNKSIGEQQVSPHLLAKVAPDVASQEGQAKLQEKRMAAQKLQGMLDKALSVAAKRLGGDSSTRVKDIDTAAKKVGQKRIQDGNDKYGIDDLRDLLGGRLVIDKNKIPAAKDEISAMEKAGLFKIKKAEERTVGTYSAFHYDVKLPDGTMGEIQLHSPKSEAVSVANHDIRAQYGDKPPKPLQQVQKKQADIIDKMPSEKAKLITTALQSMHKANNNKPIPLIHTAAVIASQAK